MTASNRRSTVSHVTACLGRVTTFVFHLASPLIYYATVWVTKKLPFFETRYRATVILRSVFVSVPFYNLPCFYCCVSILKVRRKQRLKNSKKNGVKNCVKTVQKTVRKIILVQRTFKKQCNNVFTSIPIGQMVFSDYTKRRILLLRERGKRTKEISGGKQCNNVKLQESKHECTDRTDGI